MLDDPKKGVPKPDEPPEPPKNMPSSDEDWSDGLGGPREGGDGSRTEASDWPEGLSGPLPETVIEEAAAPKSDDVAPPGAKPLPETLIEETAPAEPDEPTPEPEAPEAGEAQEPAEPEDGAEAPEEKPGEGEEKEEGSSAPEGPERGAHVRTIVSVALLVLALICLWYVAYYRHTAGHLAKQLQSESPQVRMAAAEKLKNMGDDAESALPALVRALGDKLPPVRMNASSAIQDFSPKVRERANLYLLQELKVVQDSQVRTMIVRLLETKEKPSPEVVSALLGQTRHKDASVRQAAVAALLKMAPENKAFVDSLFDSLKQKSLRSSAAASLARVSLKNKSILPRLTECLERDGAERLGALDAIASIGPRAKSALPALVTLAKRKETASVALNALSRVAPYHPETTRLLLTIAKSKSRRSRVWAARTLAQNAARNAEVLERVKEALPGLPPDARKAIEDPLRKARKL